MKVSEKTVQYKYASLGTKTKVIHTVLFLVTMDGFESWAVKETDNKLMHLVLEESFFDTLDCQKDTQSLQSNPV